MRRGQPRLWMGHPLTPLLLPLRGHFSRRSAGLGVDRFVSIVPFFFYFSIVIYLKKSHEDNSEFPCPSLPTPPPVNILHDYGVPATVQELVWGCSHSSSSTLCSDFPTFPRNVLFLSQKPTQGYTSYLVVTSPCLVSAVTVSQPFLVLSDLDRVQAYRSGIL